MSLMTRGFHRVNEPSRKLLRGTAQAQYTARLMKTLIKLSAITLALSLGLTGCKKKDENPAPAPTTEAPKSVEPTKTEPAKTEPAPAPAAEPAKTEPAAAPAPAGEVTFSSTEDYIAKATPVGVKMIEVFKGAGTDCEKLATDLNKFLDENAAFFVAVKAYEKAHPDAKKAYSKAFKPQEKEFEAVATNIMKACMKNQNVMNAIERLSK
jgi:hypothetical protein